MQIVVNQTGGILKVQTFRKDICRNKNAGFFITLSLQIGNSRNQLEEAMKGHILARAKLTGLYKRAS